MFDDASTDTPTKKTGQERDDEVISLAKDRYRMAEEHWNEFYRDSRATLKFIHGDQWDGQLKKIREDSGLPVVSIPCLTTFLNQITGEIRQNTPSIQIDPKDDSATPETAEKIADMIRGIQHDSNAEVAYDTAGWYAAATGLGYIRVVSEYEDEDTFLQKLVIKTVHDPEVIKLDPNHRELTGSDSEWAFIETLMTKEQYKRDYKDSKLSKQAQETGWPVDNQWIDKDHVVIVEYYWKDYDRETLYQVSDASSGNTYTTSTRPPKTVLDEGLMKIVDKREVQRCTIRWAKMNSVEILEETTWPGYCIPIVAVKGEEIWVEGKRKVKGAVKDAMDSQRVLNYFSSYQAEAVQLSPKAPYMADPRQIANFEEDYRNANVAAQAVLRYNALVVDGVAIPAPARQTSGVDISAASNIVQQARDNLKAIFGARDLPPVNDGNQTAQALLIRQGQAHTAQYIYYDNLAKAIQDLGQICVETIPTFYADTRTVQLINRNGEASLLTINNPEARENHDMTVGKYGVVVETGPSYSTKRQEGVASMLALSTAYPAAAPMLADIVAGMSDWPEAKRCADRLRLLLPPDVQAAEAASGAGMDKQAQLQNLMVQNKQMSTQLQQLSLQLQQAQQADSFANQQLKLADEEIKLLKDKTAVEVMKAQGDQKNKRDELALEEEKLIAEYRIKERELNLQERELRIEEAKLSIDAAEVASDISGAMHDHAIKSDEHMLVVKPSSVVSTTGDTEDLT